MDESILRAKKVSELREIAKTLGMKGYGALKKENLVNSILEFIKKDREHQKLIKEDLHEENIKNASGEAEVKSGTRKESSAIEKNKNAGGDNEKKISAKKKEIAIEKKNTKDVQSGIGKDTSKVKKSESDGHAKRRIKEVPETCASEEGISDIHPDGDGKYECDGILELAESGFGFLRFDNFLTGDDDVYVSPTQIRRFNLKTGDRIRGIARRPRQNEKFGALIFVGDVNGDEPGFAKHRPDFESLTPIFPNERLSLEGSSTDLSTRLIDLVAPIGKGQRGLIVAAPKAGKTVLLKKIARSIERKYPDIELFILLVDERPEEVTDMKRSLKHGQVLYSTFDKRPENHVKVSEMMLSRAQRLVEHGKDVVILLDSITRLARAYNLVVPASGRTLSGGIDPSALYKPKKFFGAARNMEEGGSITILATALVETGSRMDDVIFEEFKGTGNMELHLDRRLSEKRIFPALDLNASGTRREDLLMDQEEMEAIWYMRRALSGGDTQEVTELIIDNLASTRNNKEFVNVIKKIRL